MSAKSSSGVTEQQEAFARYYVKYGKGSIAYRKAFDVKEGTKPKTVWEAASRLVADGKVAARIAHYKKLADERWAVSVEKIAEQLALMAFVDKREIYDDQGGLKPPHEWPEHIARSVSGIEVFEERDSDGKVIGYTKKVKFESRANALQILAKWKGMLIDRVEVGTPGEFEHLSDDEIDAKLKAEEETLKALQRMKEPPKAQKKAKAKS